MKYTGVMSESIFMMVHKRIYYYFVSSFSLLSSTFVLQYWTDLFVSVLLLYLWYFYLFMYTLYIFRFHIYLSLCQFSIVIFILFQKLIFTYIQHGDIFRKRLLRFGSDLRVVSCLVVFDASCVREALKWKSSTYQSP